MRAGVTESLRQVADPVLTGGYKAKALSFQGISLLSEYSPVDAGRIELDGTALLYE